MNSERLKMLEKLLEESPDDVFLLYALSMEHLRKQPAKAWGILKDLLDKFPDYLPSYYQAAQLASAMGKTEECKSIYEKGISLAQKHNDLKTLHELQAAYQNFLFELE